MTDIKAKILNDILALYSNRKFLNILNKYTMYVGGTFHDEKRKDIVQSVVEHLYMKLHREDENFINKYTNDTSGDYIIKLAILCLKATILSSYKTKAGRELYDSKQVSYDNLTGDFTSEDLFNEISDNKNIDDITLSTVNEYEDTNDMFLDNIYEKIKNDSNTYEVAKIMLITLEKPEYKFRYLCETMFESGEISANYMLMYQMQREYYNYLKNWIKRNCPINEDPTNNPYYIVDNRKSKGTYIYGQQNERKERLKKEIHAFIKNNNTVSIMNVAKKFNVSKSFIYNNKLHKI